MLDIPFPVESVPAAQAEKALKELIDERDGVAPVLLGDRDVFSTEWAEYVDVFENPETILAEARSIDTDRWFANRKTPRKIRTVDLGVPHQAQSWLTRMTLLPVTALNLPLRMVKGLIRTPDLAVETPIAETRLVQALNTQLAELEAAGEGTDVELAEIREVIAEIEAGVDEGVFPDPVDYVTPRRGGDMAAGLVKASEPWESAAWLQHGAYAICAPKSVYVAHCRWLWNENDARLITASTDHLGFQMERPIGSLIEAVEVMRRFEILGATEINGDLIGADGKSLINADRLWVWWD
ncbi:hypothetical protein N9L47_04100 [Rhodobacteraceae bacterium]|nr:hypothetical protein [Paracoccaceae bacterium]